jgi:hypothetical protein
MPEINDSLIRAASREAGVIANHILECRERLQALSNKVYPQLALADPRRDRDFEQFLVHLCRAVNSLHDAAPVAHWAEKLHHFRLPEPAAMSIGPCAADPRAAMAPFAPSPVQPGSPPSVKPVPSVQSVPKPIQEPALCNA